LYYTNLRHSAIVIHPLRRLLPIRLLHLKSCLPPDALLNPGQLLIIPAIFEKTSPSAQLLPDSEIVFSPSAVDFDVQAYVNEAGGYLSEYRQELTTGWLSGAQVIERVAIENSINPRLLLTILEVQSAGFSAAHQPCPGRLPAGLD
jgi:hypothetical protein